MSGSARRRKRFAFLLHPRGRADIERFKGRLPADVTRAALRDWTPVILSRLVLPIGGDEIEGLLIVVPMTPAQLFGLPRRFVRAKILEAAELAAQEGCQVIGLGALTAVLTVSGQWLVGRVPGVLTTGNAYTAAVTVELVRALAGGKLAGSTVAIVGATGSVGQCCARLLSGARISLILIGRNVHQLEMLEADLTERGPVRTSTKPDAVGGADYVVLATAAPEMTLRSSDIRDGSTVIDVSEPTNFEWNSERRPEARRISVCHGGLVRIPELRLGLDLYGAPDIFHSCFAESVLMTVDPGFRDHQLARPTPQIARRMASLAASYGIAPATLRRDISR